MRYPLFVVLVIMMACAGGNTQLVEESKSDTSVTQNVVTGDATDVGGGAEGAGSKPVYLRATYRNRGYICGDFDGNKSVDTLYQISVSAGNEQHVVLKAGGVKAEMLYSAMDLGFYVFLNIGDVNGDERDDIAVVPIRDDFSLLNSCQVYSLCGKQWKEVENFEINESSFDFKEGDLEDSISVHSQINGSLEKRDGVWMYKDYMEWYNAETEEEASEMHILKAKRCGR